jgi:hypothetical protein
MLSFLIVCSMLHDSGARSQICQSPVQVGSPLICAELRDAINKRKGQRAFCVNFK